jgi:hypothetical protein
VNVVAITISNTTTVDWYFYTHVDNAPYLYAASRIVTRYHTQLATPLLFVVAHRLYYYYSPNASMERGRSQP